MAIARIRQAAQGVEEAALQIGQAQNIQIIIDGHLEQDQTATVNGTATFRIVERNRPYQTYFLREFELISGTRDIQATFIEFLPEGSYNFEIELENVNPNSRANMEILYIKPLPGETSDGQQQPESRLEQRLSALQKTLAAGTVVSIIVGLFQLARSRRQV